MSGSQTHNGEDRRGVGRPTSGDEISDSPNQMLDLVEQAEEDMQHFMQVWHRAIVCGKTSDQRLFTNDSHERSVIGRILGRKSDGGLVDQPAFQDLEQRNQQVHDRARLLAVRAASGETISTQEYDSLINQVNRFYDQAGRIADAFRKLVSQIDPLTGLHNRQTMLQELDIEFDRGRRSGSKVCVALTDIDHFKSVNDTYGHGVGDLVLASVAGRFQSHLRPYDTIYRYGGEEFLICLPNADAGSAAIVLNRLRLALCDEPIALGDGKVLTVTSSFGIAEFDYNQPVKSTIELADQALYAAKEGGRNAIHIWDYERDGPVPGAVA